MYSSVGGMICLSLLGPFHVLYHLTSQCQCLFSRGFYFGSDLFVCFPDSLSISESVVLKSFNITMLGLSWGLDLILFHRDSICLLDVFFFNEV